MKKRHVFAFTLGDPAGIGGEILIKTLAKKDTYVKCVPIAIADEKPLIDALRFVDEKLTLHEISSPAEAEGKFGVIDFISPHLLDNHALVYGQVDPVCGDCAFHYVTKGISLAMNREVDAVITGPLNKEALMLAGHHYAGHTEIFADYTGTKDFGMMLMSGNLRVVHVTTHVAMREACDIILNHPERVRKTIELAQEAMVALGIKSPRIAVAGLNAHSSENGLFGQEEEKSILPAIRECQKMGLNVEGPVPPDTVFVKAMGGQYDIVVAMYHDQGHIPLKLSGFRMDEKTGLFTSMSGINVTLGLPIIRTSVDHGTAFDKANKGVSNEGSLIEALDAAVLMADQRFPLKEGE